MFIIQVYDHYEIGALFRKLICRIAHTCSLLDFLRNDFFIFLETISCSKYKLRQFNETLPKKKNIMLTCRRVSFSRHYSEFCSLRRQICTWCFSKVTCACLSRIRNILFPTISWDTLHKS